MRKILKSILNILAKRVLAHYHPMVIGITGSVGKTTTKEAVYAVLHRRYFARKSSGNANTEIGIPLAILGLESAGSHEHPATVASRIMLLIGIIKSIPLAFGTSKKSFPRVLILELGADRPGDIGYLAEMVRPQIAVISAVGETPVHVEFYENSSAVAREKAKILNYLGTTGLAVLNYDDSVVMAMRSKIKSHVTTFGFSNNADLWVSDLAFYLGAHDTVAGLSFKIHKDESFLPIRLPGFVAAHQLYAVLSAVAIGLHMGMNLVEIAHTLETIVLPPHRLSLVAGKNQSIIIDDTYNASPLSMQSGLDALKNFPGGRKVAILGQMAELGKYSADEHKAIAEYARKCADVVLWCKKSDELFDKIGDLVQSGDVILVKGSRVARMEKIVDLLRA